MKTFSPKKQELKDKKWYIIDLKDQILGKAATRIANILRGKDKPIFAPHIDCGDYIVVINAAHIKLTGKKATDKMYQRHSGYPGGFKEESAGKLISRKPEELIRQAVFGMLPKNRLRKGLMLKLKIYPETEHKNEAQDPKKIDL